MLRPLALRNKRVVFGILFRSAADTLRTIAADEKHLGAQIGFTAILHTWSQKLSFHPHLHCVVTGGGLTADGKRWAESRSPNFFLPVRALGRLFRGKFLHALVEARERGELDFEGSTADLANGSEWRALIDRLYSSEWVVYAKPPFGDADQVFRYLGRYTHRVAISNHRLIEFADGQVRFKYRDYKDNGTTKVLHLDAIEFIRRFLLHVLPRRFVRIRHFGLLAGRNVKTKLLQARRLLSGSTPDRDESSFATTTPIPWWERLLQLTGIDIFACPACRTGRLSSLPLQLDGRPTPRSPPAFDSS